MQPFLISSTLEAVLGQRLVRTICSNCKESLEPDDETLSRLDLTREQILDAVQKGDWETIHNADQLR